MTTKQLTELRQLLSHAIANKTHEQICILTVAQTSDLLAAAEREAKLREALKKIVALLDGYQVASVTLVKIGRVADDALAEGGAL